MLLEGGKTFNVWLVAGFWIVGYSTAVGGNTPLGRRATMNGERVGANRVNGTDAITEHKAIPDNDLTTVAPAKVVFDPNAKGMAAFREAPSSSSEV